MKKIIFISAFVLMTFSLIAQVPQAISYQAIARDTNGAILSNHNISLRISILIDSITGSSVYTEIHNDTTNHTGLVNISIGTGQVVSGDFASINWRRLNCFIKTEADISGGSNFSTMGISQFLTVPYAFNALSARSLLLTSPSGHTYEVTIDDNGNIITNCSPQPTQAYAGPDQLSVIGNSTTIVANTPVIGTGLWTISSGAGGSFADSTNPNTLFYGQTGLAYHLVWTISNDCGSSSDTVNISFPTILGFVCGDIITDIRDGNNYNTVQIGTQCWMAENLARLPSVSHPGTLSSTLQKYYVIYYYGTNVFAAIATSNYQTYGVLYNWPAAMAGDVSSNNVPSGVKGICPVGWHLPSKEEWKILAGEVDSQYGYPDPEWNGTGWCGTDAGDNLKETGTIHWNSPNTGATNSSGFTALPGGRIATDIPTFEGLGESGGFWSSTVVSSEIASSMGLSQSSPEIALSDWKRKGGRSVRCLKNI